MESEAHYYCAWKLGNILRVMFIVTVQARQEICLVMLIPTVQAR